MTVPVGEKTIQIFGLSDDGSRRSRGPTAGGFE